MFRKLVFTFFEMFISRSNLLLWQTWFKSSWTSDNQTDEYTNVFCCYVKACFHHWMSLLGWDHNESSGSTSLLKQGPSKAHIMGLSPDGSWVSPVRKTPQPLWVICSIGELKKKKIWPGMWETIPQWGTNSLKMLSSGDFLQQAQ